MPEGHTIHRLARDHHRWFAGHRVRLSSPQGRFAEEALVLDGALFEEASAHGKHLFYRFARPGLEHAWVHIHLGLFGRYRSFRSPTPPTPNVRLRLEHEGRIVDLSGPTCCELIDHEGVQALHARLGPDPLGAPEGVDEFRARLAKRSVSIAAALMDQRTIAGIGNIYRAELLFHHQLDPMTPCRDLSDETIEALWKSASDWLELGVKAKRIVTVLPPGTRSVPRAMEGDSLHIYRRERCPRCGGAIEATKLAQRVLYSCPSCQKRRS